MPGLYSLPQPVFIVSSVPGTVLDSGDEADAVSVQTWWEKLVLNE